MARDSRTVLDRPAPPPDLTLAYGEHPDQVADVRLPTPWPATPPALVIMLHGGFWRAAYDRTHLGPFAVALAGAGFVVVTPEYRRTGAPGGGWPGTFDDVAAALAALPGLVAERIGAPLGPVVLAGHSAGGHLALWAAARAGDAGAAGSAAGVVALAPVADLGLAHELGLDGGAVADLLGGGPAEVPQRYAAADPVRLVPLGVRVTVVHGTGDAIVPIELSRRFVAAAAGAGDAVRLEAYDGGHFEVIDPESGPWSMVVMSVRAASRD